MHACHAQLSPKDTPLVSRPHLMCDWTLINARTGQLQSWFAVLAQKKHQPACADVKPTEN
jgi:hypothetical protein